MSMAVLTGAMMVEKSLPGGWRLSAVLASSCWGFRLSGWSITFGSSVGLECENRLSLNWDAKPDHRPTRAAHQHMLSIRQEGDRNHELCRTQQERHVSICSRYQEHTCTGELAGRT